MPDIDMPCPRTGRLVATGLSLPLDIFETADLSGERFDCPACGEVHALDKAACRLLTGWDAESPAGYAPPPACAREARRRAALR